MPKNSVNRRASWRSYAERNREKRCAHAKEYYQRNREAILARVKARNDERKEERAQQMQQWRRENPELAYEVGRRSLLKRKYGLTQAQWDALFARQGQCCAICRSPSPRDKRNWHTDHCHATGRVRGILCSACNRMVHSTMTPDILRRAANYIETAQEGAPMR